MRTDPYETAPNSKSRLYAGTQCALTRDQ